METLSDLFEIKTDVTPTVPEISLKLKERLIKEPGYEVWLPLTYYRSEAHIRKNPEIKVVTSNKFLVSNKGNVVSLMKGSPNQLTLYFSVNGYICVTVNNLPIRLIQVHRALGCLFVPVPEHLEGVSLNDLEVNHIDGVKKNLDLSNLEWTTATDNKLHAVENGLVKSGKESSLTKPVKGTVLVGEHTGYEFILFGLADYIAYGFVQPNVVGNIMGRTKSHRNCLFVYATEDETETLPRGLTKEIHETLKYLSYRRS